MDSRATALCEAEALGAYTLVDEEYDRLMSVTSEDVRDVTARYLCPDRTAGVFYLPRGESNRFCGGAWPLQPTVDTHIQHPVFVSIASGSSANADSVVEEVHYDGNVTRRSYPGADLLVRSKPGCGLVTLGLDVTALPSLETAANNGISRLLVRSTVRGAGGRTGEELALVAESLGGGIVASSSVDGLGWGITVPPESLRAAAELLRIVALEPTLDSSDIEKERTLQVSDARRSQDDMFSYPIQRVLAQAFDGDAYGLPQIGEPDTVEGLKEDEIRAWADAVGSYRATVVAVGDMDTGELMQEVAPLVAWPEAEPTVAKPSNHVPFHVQSGSERRDKTQSALAMAFPSVPADSPDRFAIIVLGTLLSGLAGRLFEELRDKRSLAYTVAAVPWLRRRAGAMLTYIATSPEREAEARDAMLEELERLVEERVTEQELTRARNYAAGLVEMRQQNASSVASEILSAWLNGVLDEYAAAAQRLRAVTADDIARVAADIFGAGQRAEYVVRGVGQADGRTGGR
jgi:zinc protease